MPKLLIIADDLTGAADCAARFAENGIESAVFLGRGNGESGKIAAFKGAEVLAVDADTRCLDAEQAAASVSRIVDTYQDATDVIFKKIDSTLRGNVGAELAAVLKPRRQHTSTRCPILLAPAFPECGRSTVNGRQLVHGQPVENSPFWRPGSTGVHIGIAAMLEGVGLSCALVELSRIRAGSSLLERALRKGASEADVVICDAETETDLEAITRAGILLGENAIWAGSAGLARRLADGWAEHPRRAMRAPTPRVRGPALFVVGSPAEVSREQARALAAIPDIFALSISATDLFCCSKAQEHADLISRRLQDGCDVLLQLDSGELYDPQQGRRLAQSLAGMIGRSVHDAGSLLATGGETARAILDAWGIGRLRLQGEVKPGLPYSVAQSSGREILVLTKAGGFGTRDTLIRCREFLRAFMGDSDLS